ncbi:tumor necrosis factor-inducible gene 6 protein-like [Mytilus edulis]|uniref:tumor necrosis factor-inducible gene 6 protein-like n=1 Tax=Mytilus edulis TaxID=6550 RepID=UPI0039EF5AC6
MKIVAIFFIVIAAVVMIHHVEGRRRNVHNERKEAFRNKIRKYERKEKCRRNNGYEKDVGCLNCKDACNTDVAGQEYIDINGVCSGNNTCCKPCSDTCGGSFTGPMGSFTSPNFPSNYCNNQNCYFNITVEDGDRVMLNFTTLHTAFDGDFLQIYNGEIEDTFETFLYRGGPYPPTEIDVSDNPSSNKIIVHLHSDETQTQPGFQVTYKTF